MFTKNKGDVIIPSPHFFTFRTLFGWSGEPRKNQVDPVFFVSGLRNHWIGQLSSVVVGLTCLCVFEGQLEPICSYI